MLYGAQAPSTYWSVCINHAALLLNLRPHPHFPNTTPYYLYHHRFFDYNRLKIWGCLCVTSVPMKPRSVKFASINHRAIFIGLSANHKAYVLIDLDTNSVCVSHRVRFYEKEFPFSTYRLNPSAKQVLNYLGGVQYVDTTDQLLSVPTVPVVPPPPTSGSCSNFSQDNSHIDPSGPNSLSITSPISVDASPISVDPDSTISLDDSSVSTDDCTIPMDSTSPVIDSDSGSSSHTPQHVQLFHSIDEEAMDEYLATFDPNFVPGPVSLPQYEVEVLDSDDDDALDHMALDYAIFIEEPSTPISSPPPNIVSGEPPDVSELISVDDISGFSHPVERVLPLSRSFPSPAVPSSSSNLSLPPLPSISASSISPSDALVVHSSSSGSRRRPFSEVEEEDIRAVKSFRTNDGIFTLSTSSELVPYQAYTSIALSVDPLESDFSGLENSVPKFYHEIKFLPDASAWYAACDAELQALEDNRTWIVASLPPNRSAISSRWVFARKMDGRLKARVVARGFSQLKNVDFFTTFSPVISYPSVRILLSISVQFNLVVHHLDISNAFTQSDLLEEIYMTPPPGVHIPDGKVLRLLKSLYGLRQASATFNLHLHSTLLKLGFSNLASEPCIYQRSIDSSRMLLGVYVDDILCCAPTVALIEIFVRDLQSFYKLRYIGECSSFLGLDLVQSPKHLSLHAKSYISRMLDDANLTSAFSNRFDIPISPSYLSARPSSDLPGDATAFRSLVGKFLYLANTCRPDIAFITNWLSRFLKAPTEHHSAIARRVLRYLVGSVTRGLHYTPSPSFQNRFVLEGFTDSTWADTLDCRRSTTGYIFMFANGPISWSSHKQHTTSTSSTESELYALSAGTKEFLWLLQVFQQLDIPLLKLLYCDNIGAIALSEHKSGRNKLKHVDVQYFFLRDHVNKDFVLKYINTKLMRADFLTKPLSAPLFADQLGLINMN
ncbi:hypothetical protein G210_5234 [Candida maltosa Xu316]|uniref:Uncharacterized protein n=1 Tax=Candida maltosa (strain Xu316) TaxID=1245528 RepID=M3JSF6_CANMX|nr:hypothetical protein G210_5234 [Candida maltosa Xu316]